MAMSDPGIFVVITEMRKRSCSHIEELTSSHREVSGSGVQVEFKVSKANTIRLNKEVKKVMPEVSERALQLKDLEAITSTVRLF